MNRNQLFLSTIAANGPQLARRWQLGLEIASFCTPQNLDEAFDQTASQLRPQLEAITSRCFHGPFSELFPCAVDPKARELAAFRYRQAIDLAKRYHCTKVVLHGGFSPSGYYPQWYIAQSVDFWRTFLRQDPGITIVLENVLEGDSAWLPEILAQVRHPRMKMCLDVGHVHAYSHQPISQWLEACSPYIDHIHLHDNDGTADQHLELGQGTIPWDRVLDQIRQLCPHASLTLEVVEAETSLTWLHQRGWI